MITILSGLQRLFEGRLLWSGLLLGCLGALAVAVYYQYALDEWPCVICIQIRLWISLLAIVSLIALMLKTLRLRYASLQWVFRLSLLGIALGLSERSYNLLGTERGFVFSDCGFDTGLPSWLAVDQWLPWLYRVDASCGYTPELWLGVTMAEALMLASVILLILAVMICLQAVLALVSKQK